MVKTLAYLLVVILLFTGCNKRLDNFLFNGDTEISSYRLDKYPGPTTFRADDYFVPEELIHKFSYPIQLEDGSQSNISVIYTGDTSRIDQDTVILYCHGTRDHMDFYWPRQKLYTYLDPANPGRYGVMMIDYPGYGLSKGKSTEENMYASVIGAIDWLAERGMVDDRFVMMGFSLGTAPTCKIAAGDYSLTPSKIILEAPFASAEVMVQDASLLAVPGSFLVNVKIDNAEQIKNIFAPLLWMHGISDDFLSVKTHGEVVFENHNGLFKKSVLAPLGEHETVPVEMGFSKYNKEILDFILQKE